MMNLFASPGIGGLAGRRFSSIGATMRPGNGLILAAGLIAIAATGCTLNEKGVGSRLDRLIEYGTYQPMGHEFYDERYYKKRGPIHKVRKDLQKLREK